MSFLDKIKGSDSANIFLVRGRDDTTLPCYFYIEVDKTKRPLFEKFKKGQQVNLEEFGKVLESGYGEPSEEIKERMKEEYNYVEASSDNDPLKKRKPEIESEED